MCRLHISCHLWLRYHDCKEFNATFLHGIIAKIAKNSMLLSQAEFYYPSIAREWTRMIQRVELIECAGMPLFSLFMITFLPNQCSGLARICWSALFHFIHDHDKTLTSRALNFAGFSKYNLPACECTSKYALNECSAHIQSFGRAFVWCGDMHTRML